jgi:protein phosphatase
VTRDDTLLQEMLRTGSISPADAESFPHKNILLQVLGTGGELKVGVCSVEARRGDVVLLCTDGIHGLLSDAAIRAVLLRHHHPGVAARVLVDEAMRRGGHDNIALLIARLDGGAPEPGEAPLEVVRIQLGRG